MNHRGPDHSEYFFDKNISLGYNRLSIIDLKTGNQPVYNEENTLVLFYNGELYNYQNLREELEKKGHRFKSASDTEVIIHAYEEYGELCVNYFNGMFAFVIYDIETKKLFIARDRLGIKPMYYYFKDKKFMFASEIKAILQYDEIKKEICYPALNDYLSYRYTTGQNTMLKNIFKLLPGHYLIFENNNLLIREYWDYKPDNNNHGLDYYSKKFKDLLESSIKHRMISDVPIGALLSGGIDSSSIVAMMALNSDQTIKTYTLGFEESNKNEFDAAKLVSDKFETDHKEIMIDSSYVNQLPKVIWHLDDPVADPTAIPNYVLANKVSKDVKVLLNGDGADELLMGYEQYKLMTMLKKYQKTPSLLRSSVLTSFNIMPNEPFFYKLEEFVNKDNNLAKSYHALVSIFGSKEKQLIVKKGLLPELKIQNSESKVRRFFDKKTEFLNKMSYHDMMTFLPDNMLLKYDKMTMAHSVEGRVPFCDHRIAEFAASLPVKYKLNGSIDKYILRHSMKGILPDETIKRKKQRFFVPTENWYNKEFGNYARKTISDKHEIVNKFFNKSYIEKLFNRNKLLSHKLLKINSLTKLYYTRQLWTITNFVEWYDIFVNGDKV